MLDARDAEAGTIDLRRTDDGPRYRVEYRGDLLGWATTLKTATERLHRDHFRRGSQRGDQRIVTAGEV